MATHSIILPKTAFNRQGFTKIARFTVAESSLYQALSVGLFEILIRLKNLPSLLSRCLASYQSLTPSDPDHISNQLAKKYSKEYQFTQFKGIANVLHTEKDTNQAFSWLQQYAERNDFSSSLDDGMRVLLASILPEHTALHEEMMRHRFVDEQVLLFNFAIKLNIQINVVTATEMIEYKKHLPGGYPLITLWMQDRAYSLLYTSETCMIEEGNFNYQRIHLEPYPFFIPENYRVIREPAQNIPQLGGSASNPVLKIGNKAAVQASPQLSNNNSTQSSIDIRKSLWIPPPPDPKKLNSNKVEGIPLGNYVDTSAAAKKSDSQPINERFQEGVAPDFNSFTINTYQMNRNINISNHLLLCMGCNTNRGMNEFNIECPIKNQCEICSTCRARNLYQCLNCQRPYSEEEKKLITNSTQLRYEHK